MQPQQLEGQRVEGQRAQTILVVDSDEPTRRILDLSLRHAGFAVRVASSAEEGDRRLADRPDLVIVAADDAAGLDFCRRAKQGDAMAPAVVLLLDAGVESKRRGLEAGADDFVARPIYVQEVVARSRALLQRRDRERLEQSAHDNERFISSVEDVPLVDLLRAIAANQKSGVALVMGGGGARGELFFRQGRVVDAEVGRLSGREAVYRLFCWSSGSLTVEWKSIRRKDTIELAPHDLLMEALRRVDEWRRLLAGVPPLDTMFEVDYRLLAERLADIPDEVNRILRLFDGVRTFLQVIDDCGLPDLDAVAAIGKLYRERIIHDIRLSAEDEESVSAADMEGWLSDAAGPFRSPTRHERDLFGAGPDPGVGVHGRRTAPIDPLGEGSREALDDDMRVRFTDRLQAEGANAAEPLNPDADEAIPELPLEALVDSAPASNGARPSTLPGLGAAKSDSSQSRPASELPVAAAAADDVSPATTLQGAAPPAPSPPTSPLERPYGWSSSDSGPARSASGEIHVHNDASNRKSHAPGHDVPRVHVREDSNKAYVRKSTATPAGSARALDEPPPITATPAQAQALARAAKRDAAKRGTETRDSETRDPAPRAASKTIKIDDGRDEAFSKADAEDELGVSSRGRRVIAAVAIVLVVSGGVILALKRNNKPTLADETEAKEHATASASGPAPRAVQPTIVPLVETRAASATKPAPIDAVAGTGRKPITALSNAREELDERTADPRMARERSSEARPLLSVCRMAFEQNRMRDAEAACTAARDANPESADAHGLLAHSLFNRNKKREALASAERAVKLNPKLADAYVIIGGVRQEDGDVEEARRAYQRYLDLEPKGSFAADLRAIITRLPAKL
jgi:CheY-like chemotaxis protein